MLVEQQSPPHLALHVFQHSLVTLNVAPIFVLAIFAIIVIAHDGVHTVASSYLPKHVLERYQLFGAHVDQVARENDKIGALSIDKIYHLVNKLTVAKESAYMNIRYL